MVTFQIYVVLILNSATCVYSEWSRRVLERL